MIKHCALSFKKHFLRNHVCRLLSASKNQPKSSLFISGERASDTFVAVVPYLDFDERFSNFALLEENIKRRGLNMDVAKMKDTWDFYSSWNSKKLKLQANLECIGKQLTDYLKMGEEKKADVEILERHKNLLKEDLIQVRKNVWSMEDNVICELLNIPNTLHAGAPETEVEMYKFDKENISKGFDHLFMGRKLDCVEYRNKLTCFLKNQAALLELAVPEFFTDCFSKEGFIRFSNPDFTRSVLAEGVGLPPCNSSELFLLEQTEGNNDHLFLCGGASLFPFCGFHAKQTLPKKSLPVKYIATGRRYIPLPDKLQGLYSANQSTCVQIFVATHSEEAIYCEFQSSVDKACQVYNTLGLNFKVIKQTPLSYKNWESLRASIQVFSPYHKDFIEVGHISLIDDYVSKRLRMCYTDKTDELFLRVVSGTIINVHSIIALCLERSNTDMFIPEVVRNYMIV